VVEWDEDKAAANLRKHGVHFADAATALEDEAALTMPDDHPEEDRWVTLAIDALGRAWWSSTRGETMSRA